MPENFKKDDRVFAEPGSVKEYLASDDRHHKTKWSDNVAGDFLSAQKTAKKSAAVL